MSKITLITSTNAAIISGEGANFDHFLDWLESYNPSQMKSLKWGYYTIDSENRLTACRVKARKLNLEARKLNLDVAVG